MTFRYEPEPELEPTGPETPATTNGAGLAALIVGAAALVGAVIPLINYVSGVLALVGVALGIVGLVLKGRPRGMAVGGLIVSVIALVLSVVLAIVYTAGVVNAISGAVRETDVQSSPDIQIADIPVTYQLQGTGSATTVDATWSTFADSGAATASGEALPLTREVVVPGDATLDGLTNVSLTGTAVADDSVTQDGTITCRILVGGKPVTEETSSGVGPSVTCAATVDDLRAAAR